MSRAVAASSEFFLAQCVVTMLLAVLTYHAAISASQHGLWTNGPGRGMGVLGVIVFAGAILLMIWV